ncbi:hypothetical protein SRABI76_03352 [Microbacterium oxydans]|uniref:MerR family transcriptional regulator n=1 Tax=Microbacterium oxydans TaxID=82380 RepID=UPI001D54C317|nr:MerR family transcriptional regulator [Microbacterium oxydans]CAH0255450.1 hypothetical protein SRABI76_03352 [Microbacterium oxydans]
MGISELSAQTGVTVPTIKYYLREGLLPEGERRAPIQAAYGEKHVERLRVIRALIDAWVSVAKTRRALAALDDPPESPHLLLGAAHGAITPSRDEALDLTRAERLVEGPGWKPGMCDPAVLSAVARALRGWRTQDSSCRMLRWRSISRVCGGSRMPRSPGCRRIPLRCGAVRCVVLGSVLVESLSLALRRVARQVSSAERFSGVGGTIK